MNQIEFYEQKLAFEIDSWDLHELMVKENVTVIDVRSAEAFNHEHIPGAVNLPHREMSHLSTGELPRDRLIERLVAMQYARNDTDFYRGTFRVRGDVLDVFPAYEADRAVRIEYFGDAIDALSEIDPLRGITLRSLRRAVIYPGTHYVATKEHLECAIAEIERVLGLFRDGGMIFCTTHFVQDHCSMEELRLAYDTAYRLVREIGQG